VLIHRDPLQVPDAVFRRLGVPRDDDRIGAVFSVAGARLPRSPEALRYQAFPTHHLYRDWVTSMCSWTERAPRASFELVGGTDDLGLAGAQCGQHGAYVPDRRQSG
jgi:hypothetical protein